MPDGHGYLQAITGGTQTGWRIQRTPRLGWPSQPPARSCLNGASLCRSAASAASQSYDFMRARLVNELPLLRSCGRTGGGICVRQDTSRLLKLESSILPRITVLVVPLLKSPNERLTTQFTLALTHDQSGADAESVIRGVARSCSWCNRPCKYRNQRTCRCCRLAAAATGSRYIKTISRKT